MPISATPLPDGPTREANLRRWTSRLSVDAMSHVGDMDKLRLVHHSSSNAITAVLRSGHMLNAASARQQGYPVRSFAFDEAIGLDGYVFFTPGFGTVDPGYAAGTVLIASESFSREAMAREDALLACQDIADVLRIDACTPGDVAERRPRFEAALQRYRGHLLPASAFTNLLPGYLARFHDGDPESFLSFLFHAHQGREVKNVAPRVQAFLDEHGELPLTPEILVPGPLAITPDTDWRVLCHEDEPDLSLFETCDRLGIPFTHRPGLRQRARFDDIADHADLRGQRIAAPDPAAIRFDRQRLLHAAASHFRLDHRGVHGLAHWIRVEAIGHELARCTGADPQLITLFAFFHDVDRQDEERDPGHGARGAELAARMRGIWFDCPDAALETLQAACAGHSGGRDHPDITVRTCWDADRLDLWRLGIPPLPKRLLTDAGRDPAMSKAAKALYEANPVLELA